MEGFLTLEEDIIFSEYKMRFRGELKPHLPAIKLIIAILINSSRKEKKDLSDREVNYICMQAILQIFHLPRNREIAKCFCLLKHDFKKKHEEDLNRYYNDISKNIALLIIRVIFYNGEIEYGDK